MNIDINRLHDTIEGRCNYEGCGLTTAMLIEALQHADFPAEEPVYILGITKDWAAFLQSRFVQIAKAMRYENIQNIILHETCINDQKFLFIWPQNRPPEDPPLFFVDKGPFLLNPRNEIPVRKS